jgi:nucleotide-binding universal stress UspA family protein
VRNRLQVLAFVDESRRSDGVFSAAQELASTRGAGLTFVAVAVIEDERRGCCDLRSGIWNRMQRELAADLLRRARQRVAPGIHPALALAEGSSVEAALAEEARSGRYDVILVSDERRSALPWKAGLADRLRRRVACEVMTPVVADRGHG